MMGIKKFICFEEITIVIVFLKTIFGAREKRCASNSNLEEVVGEILGESGDPLRL